MIGARDYEKHLNCCCSLLRMGYVLLIQVPSSGCWVSLTAIDTYFIWLLQVGIGVFTKSTAEYSKRGKHFFGEIDYVAANIAMAIIADFMLVWLPAPTLAYR